MGSAAALASRSVTGNGAATLASKSVTGNPEMPEITGAMTGGAMRNNPNVIDPSSTTPAIQDISGMSGHDLRQKYAELITSGTAGTGSNRSLLKAYAARIKELSSGPNGGGAFGAFTGFDKVKDPHSFLEEQTPSGFDKQIEDVNSMNDSIEMMDTGRFSPQAQATAAGVFGSQAQRDLAAGASTSQRMIASLSRTQS